MGCIYSLVIYSRPRSLRKLYTRAIAPKQNLNYNTQGTCIRFPTLEKKNVENITILQAVNLNNTIPLTLYLDIIHSSPILRAEFVFLNSLHSDRADALFCVLFLY